MVISFYFSPTGHTKTVCQNIAQAIDKDYKDYPFTTPKERTAPALTPEDIVVVGIPTYAGRVPNLLLPYLQSVAFHGARCILVATFGNRDYDDSLLELFDIVRKNGGKVYGCGAFSCEHSFSNTLAEGRPDASDMKDVEAFARGALKNIREGRTLSRPDRAVRPYYTPRDRHGKGINFVKIKPKTDPDRCTDCKICVDLCPLGTIHYDDVSRVEKCMKCCACVKGCPESAKYFDDPAYLYHKEELEAMYSARHDNHVFL
ncbi:MAG: EFR1 family ferrodoxin [Peptoniphilus sp.]|nr:EFR1 family ferrodoxin [Peptoniphilus sp.]MDD7362618.1 EFR1 family ferrodoxin [Bacillota bacterium]MDY6044983.1 EFR1 family ferrodoxin [Peptoniphilus sp.]